MCDALEQALERAQQQLDGENSDWWSAFYDVGASSVTALGAAGAILTGTGGWGAWAAYGIALAHGTKAGADMDDAWNEYNAALAAYNDALDAYCDCLEERS